MGVYIFWWSEQHSSPRQTVVPLVQVTYQSHAPKGFGNIHTPPKKIRRFFVDPPTTGPSLATKLGAQNSTATPHGWLVPGDCQDVVPFYPSTCNSAPLPGKSRHINVSSCKKINHGQDVPFSNCRRGNPPSSHEKKRFLGILH